MKNLSKTTQEFTAMGGSIFSDSLSPSDGNIFVTDFEDSNLESFTRQVLEAEKSPMVQNIVIWVSSYGGNVHNALAMVDLIESLRKPVFTVAYGKAMSAGCLLVASGPRNNRFITPNSHMLIHEASGGAAGKAQDVIQQAKELRNLNDRLLELMSKYSKKKARDLKKILQNIHNGDLVLNAAKSVDFGLADYIGVPKSVRNDPSEIIGVFSKTMQRKPRKPKK